MQDAGNENAREKKSVETSGSFRDPEAAVEERKNLVQRNNLLPLVPKDITQRQSSLVQEHAAAGASTTTAASRAVS